MLKAVLSLYKPSQAKKGGASYWICGFKVLLGGFGGILTIGLAHGSKNVGDAGFEPATSSL